MECFANDITPVINGLLVQALWQAYEHNNVQACRMLIAHGAVVDNVFASVLHVLEEKEKFKRFLALAEGEMEIGPLQSTRPCPWYFPASYRRGVATLFMCVRRIIDDFPLNVLITSWTSCRTTRRSSWIARCCMPVCRGGITPARAVNLRF